MALIPTLGLGLLFVGGVLRPRGGREELTEPVGTFTAVTVALTGAAGCLMAAGYWPLL